ncbi:MAG TPA: phosphoribosylformylglycinamidine cyclo-ligase, partial [Acidiferrobacteraceae bacterium]|nr:phosphoribosylformylglycinamidine cyclo-ligase [Acidiferrobacteraceae bacterium]
PGFREPVLVSGTDGVGTKLKLALELNRHGTIGIDLVAMCANDVVVQGAEPLFFLDYYATGKLDVAQASAVVDGISKGCALAGAALVGGETAEMPGLYQAGDYDLAGFCVGIVERDAIIDGRRIQPNDTLIGLRSSGAHSNGYSLIRKILAETGASLDQVVGGRTLGEALLTPTRIYVKALLALRDRVSIHGMAHITGGGLPGNVPRMLPPGLRAIIDSRTWKWPPLFSWLAEAGGVHEAEMYRTFNCGIGMVLAVDPRDAETTISTLQAAGEEALFIGHIDRSDEEPFVILG